MERYTHIWEKSQKIRAHSENVVAKQRKVPSKKAGKKQSKLTSFLAPTPQVQLAAEEDQPQEQHHRANFGANHAGGLLEELAKHIDPLLLWYKPQHLGDFETNQATTPQGQFAAGNDPAVVVDHNQQEQHHLADFGTDQAAGLLDELAAQIDPGFFLDSTQQEQYLADLGTDEASTPQG